MTERNPLKPATNAFTEDDDLEVYDAAKYHAFNTPRPFGSSLLFTISPEHCEIDQIHKTFCVRHSPTTACTPWQRALGSIIFTSGQDNVFRKGVGHTPAPRTKGRACLDSFVAAAGVTLTMEDGERAVQKSDLATSELLSTIWPVIQRYYKQRSKAASGVNGNRSASPLSVLDAVNLIYQGCPTVSVDDMAIWKSAMENEKFHEPFKIVPQSTGDRTQAHDPGKTVRQAAVLGRTLEIARKRGSDAQPSPAKRPSLSPHPPFQAGPSSVHMAHQLEPRDWRIAEAISNLRDDTTPWQTVVSLLLLKPAKLSRDEDRESASRRSILSAARQQCYTAASAEINGKLAGIKNHFDASNRLLEQVMPMLAESEYADHSNFYSAATKGDASANVRWEWLKKVDPEFTLAFGDRSSAQMITSGVAPVPVMSADPPSRPQVTSFAESISHLDAETSPWDTAVAVLGLRPGGLPREQSAWTECTALLKQAQQQTLSTTDKMPGTKEAVTDHYDLSRRVMVRLMDEISKEPSLSAAGFTLATAQAVADERVDDVWSRVRQGEADFSVGFGLRYERWKEAFSGA